MLRNFFLILSLQPLGFLSNLYFPEIASMFFQLPTTFI